MRTMTITTNYKFELGSCAFITDPCYSRGTWCMGEVKTKPGVWYTAALMSDEGSWGMRVKTLLAWHESSDDFTAEYTLNKLPFEVGVDSGQAGIFCESIYPDGDTTGEYGDLNAFYGKACAASDTGSAFGIVDGRGVCSESGYGDGGYSAFAKFDGDECVAIRIEFIPDECFDTEYGLDEDEEDDI